MKLIGLMVVKNESWIFGLSLRAALKWCDEVVVVDHASWDDTYKVIHDAIGEHPYRIHYSRWEDTKTEMIRHWEDGKDYPVQVPDPDAFWPEMKVRQHSLDLGRKFGGTHFAMIDADELLTCNLLDTIRPWCDSLEPGEMIDLPLIAAWRSLAQYRDDENIAHTSRSAVMSVVFRDIKGSLTWQPQGDGYQFHSRAPAGITKRLTPLRDRRQGGVIHAQWCDWDRITAKHIHYKMQETIRWPARSMPEELERKYSEALREEDMRLAPCPANWLNYYVDDIAKHFLPGKGNWYLYEIKKLYKKYGAEAFKGLHLKGLEQ